MGLRSMTGFGRAELKPGQNAVIKAEIKTSNHKFLEISSKLPPHLAEYEENIRKILGQHIRRGKVNLFVGSPDVSVFSNRLFLNEALAKEVFHKVQRLKTALKLKKAFKDAAREEEVLFREVIRYPDVLTKDTTHNQSRQFFRGLERTVLEALRKLKVSRDFEGKAIERDLRRRLLEMKRSLSVVARRIPQIEKEFRRHLEAKAKQFLKNGEADTDRLTQEVAVFVKNSDISEEVTRLRSHMEAMAKTLRETGELGRKIDFIAQEMSREANTMGAKSNDVSIANAVIQIKSAIEKIREQAQNVE
jgi:uncharacterized protein (TIGR00255 family)